MRSMRRHDGAFRDASPPPRSRPAKWVADSLETIWLAAQDHRLVPVVPGDRFRSRALAYGKPCASQRCMHGLAGGVGTSSSEVFHAYPTETPCGSVHESPVRHLPHARGCTVKGIS